MLSKCISRCIYLMFDFCDVMPPMLGFCGETSWRTERCVSMLLKLKRT